MSFSLFIILLLSWVVIRYAGKTPLSLIDDWFSGWVSWLLSRFSDAIDSSSFTRDTLAVVLLCIIAVVPALAVALFIALFGHWFWGLIGWVVSLSCFLYACGREDFDLSVLSLQQAARLESHDNMEGKTALLANASYARWFPVAFWFLLLGPAFVVLYQCIVSMAGFDRRLLLTQSVELESDEVDVELTVTRVSDTGVATSIADLAHIVLVALNWLPVRLWSALMLLVGNFSEGLSTLREQILTLDHGSLMWAVNQSAMVSESGDEACVLETEEQVLFDEQFLERFLRFNDKLYIAALIFILLFALF
jgi:membrane protein required for beta-lactamase induction